MLSWLHVKKHDERKKAHRKGRSYIPLFERLERERAKIEEAKRQKLLELSFKDRIFRSVLGR